MITTTETNKSFFDRVSKLDEHLEDIGLPVGKSPEPLKYDLRKIQHFVHETGKDFMDLSDEEKQNYLI